jgi:hypothetical protein
VNPFQSLREYEEFVYTLRHQFPSIVRSTLVVIRLGKRSAVLEGILTFAAGYRLSIAEQLSTDIDAVRIDFYGDEFWHHDDKIAWYDPQPHPNDPTLANTHPHHKHVPPNIKHNRIPAPGLSFMQPNLPLLIHEIESLIAQPPATQADSTTNTEEPKSK